MPEAWEVARKTEGRAEVEDERRPRCGEQGLKRAAHLAMNMSCWLGLSRTARLAVPRRPRGHGSWIGADLKNWRIGD